MKKIKFTITFELEAYEPIMEYYPENSTLEDVAKIDTQNLLDDPFTVIDNPNTIVKVTHEIVEE